MKTISVKLPEPLANWLAQKASVSGRSQSEIVREALEKEKKNPRRKKNWEDVIQGIGGGFAGPTDLSTNPKYMDGFGED